MPNREIHNGPERCVLATCRGARFAFMLDNGSEVSCQNCRASCCRLEVMLISDTGVPKEHIEVDPWGGEVMARLEDGWCSALDRGTFMCTIYEQRPWICREFEMASHECVTQRLDDISSCKQSN